MKYSFSVLLTSSADETFALQGGKICRLIILDGEVCSLQEPAMNVPSSISLSTNSMGVYVAYCEAQDWQKLQFRSFLDVTMFCLQTAGTY